MTEPGSPMSGCTRHFDHLSPELAADPAGHDGPDARAVPGGPQRRPRAASGWLPATRTRWRSRRTGSRSAPRTAVGPTSRRGRPQSSGRGRPAAAARSSSGWSTRYFTPAAVARGRQPTRALVDTGSSTASSSAARATSWPPSPGRCPAWPSSSSRSTRPPRTWTRSRAGLQGVAAATTPGAREAARRCAGGSGPSSSPPEGRAPRGDVVDAVIAAPDRRPADHRRRDRSAPSSCSSSAGWRPPPARSALRCSGSASTRRSRRSCARTAGADPGQPSRNCCGWTRSSSRSAAPPCATRSLAATPSRPGTRSDPLGLGQPGRRPSSPDPDEFDLDRERNRHLAFGAGPHRCVGSNLARMNLRVALEELLRRLDDIRAGRRRSGPLPRRPDPLAAQRARSPSRPP